MPWENYPGQIRPSDDIAELEARIAQVPPDQRSNYQLRQRGIEIPPGYRLERDGSLKYVQVDNAPEAPWYLRREVVLPAIASAGMALGGGIPGVPGLEGSHTPWATSGSAGSAATGGIPTIPSTAIGTGMGTAPSLSGAVTAGGTIGGGAAALGGGAVAGKGVWDWMKRQGKDALTGGDDDDDGWGDDAIRAAIAAMAGLSGLRNSGPSPEENALAEQMRKLLEQQQQRTTYADPLYKATMQMAYGLLPQRSGDYPGGT